MQTVDFFSEELLRWQLLDEDAVGYGQEAPGAVGAGGGDVERSCLQGIRILGNEAREYRLGAASVCGSWGTADVSGECIIRLRGNPIIVAILHGQIRRSNDRLWHMRHVSKIVR